MYSAKGNFQLWSMPVRYCDHVSDGNIYDSRTYFLRTMHAVTIDVLGATYVMGHIFMQAGQIFILSLWHR